MRNLTSILALWLTFTAACASSSTHTATPTPAPLGAGLKVKLTTVYVDDQAKALAFYTDVMGFAKKDDFTNGDYRWLSVTSPADPNGTELHLALDSNPAAKAFQQAQFTQGEPAVMFYTDDLKGAYERIKAKGGAFTMPPTEVMPGSSIATLEDTCGNLVQITQLSGH